MLKYAIQLLRTLNDRSGNPRRIMLVYDLTTGGIKFGVYFTYGEWYSVLTPTDDLDYKELQNRQLPTVDVSVAEFSATLEYCRDQDCLRKVR